MLQYASHNINSFNVSNNFIVADDRSNILAWLSPLDPKSRHQDIQDRRVENIGNGCYKLRNSEAGALVVGEMNLIKESCFAMEIRGSARLISGNKDEPRGIEVKSQY